MTYKEIDPSMWNYTEKGDKMEGFLIQAQQDVGENKSNLYTIEAPEGVLRVWGTAILDAKLGLVRLGDKVKITYKGLGEAQGHKNAPKLFKVEVDKQT